MRTKLLLREHPQTLETRRAAMRPATFDATANTIEAVIATDAAVARRDARGPFLEILDIAGADLDAFRGASVLDSHRQDGVAAVLGTVDEAWTEGTQLVARIRLSTRPEVAPLVEDVRAGVIRSMSVGFEVGEWRDGTDAQGRRTRTAVKWTPREVSFVPVSADPAARTRSHGPAPQGRAAVNRSIRELARRAGVADRVADDLIDREASIEDARGIVFENLLTRGGLPMMRASVGADYTDPDLQNRAIVDAIYSKMTGIAPTGAARELAHRPVIDMMRHWATVNGVHLRNDNPSDVYQTVMNTRATVGLHTASDFPSLLLEAANRRLGAIWRAAESGASAIVATGTARDFRPVTEARMTSFPSLEPVGENGEIRWGTLSDEGEKLAIRSVARAIGVSFQALVNDDLGAIDRAIRDTGFAAAQAKAGLIVAALNAILSDNLPLFDDAHGNLAPAGTPLDENSLSEGRVAMAKQSPPGSTEPLGLSPAILLVPSELQTAAEKLVAAINPSSSENVNVFAGKLQVAVEPRLPTATEWYLFAAPGTYPVVRFSTLAGYESPRFESENLFTRLGTAYRVHWHVGAGPIDFRGAWKNPGLPSP